MIRQDKTDEYIRNVVAEMVRDPRVVAAMSPQDDDGHLADDRLRRDVLKQRLADFVDDYAQSLITGQQLRKVTESVTKELTEIDERMTWAKRRPAKRAPHWYIVAGKTPGISYDDFIRAGRVIRTFGEPGKFYRMTRLYLFTEDRLAEVLVRVVESPHER